VGLIVDTNVFIRMEREGEPVGLSQWDPTDEVYISVVTVSELLMGVHRAENSARRDKRSAFVETIISGIQVLDFTTEVARDHAALHAQLMSQGQLIGAHDLIIAATAIHRGFTLLTDNVEEFRRVPTLNVLAYTS
jgi:predicted nucleic acid-binding protein